MMRRLLALVFVSACWPAAAQTIRAPHLTPGDSWSYEDAREMRGTRRVTHDTATLVRADSHFITLEIRPTGNPNPGVERLFGPDWSRVRSVNGQQTLVNQPVAYPMAVGRSWTVSYTELNPNRVHTREQWTTVYKAVRWEDVTVPAGTFHALKIEGDGTWKAELPPNVLTTVGRTTTGGALATRTQQGARVASGRLLKAFWYAPEVHRWVKSEEDIYDSNGVRTEHSTENLEGFTAADSAPGVDEAPAPAAAPARPKHVKAHTAPREPKAPAKPNPARPAPLLPPLQETWRGLDLVADA